MKVNYPIGILDSGVGGLSVFAKIKKVLPNENIIYVGDQAYHPYSKHSKRGLEKRVSHVADFLLSYNVKVLVIACNTASCQVLPYLRSNYKLPIVGVVPAIKPAVKIENVSKITVLSTSKTARSRYLNNLIDEFAFGKKVFKVNCDGLQEAIEDQDLDKIANLLRKYTAKIKRFKTDVVVLACTHYSFLKDQIQKEVKVRVIEPSSAIAGRVSELLKSPKEVPIKSPAYTFFSTGNPGKFSEVATKLLGYKIKAKKAAI